MRRGLGVPLRDRLTLGGGAPQQPRRHCWVMGEGLRHPGLVLAWQKRGDEWWALATYFVEAEGQAVTRWVSEREIEPA